MDAIEIFLNKNFELEFELLPTVSEQNECNDLIKSHIQYLDTDENKSITPKFQTGLEWMNTDGELTLDDLKGKVVILDFFTYCCINCIHILPQLEKLEKKYRPEDGVVVIGVHSAKFTNEKLTSNILSAVLRYDIQHPVVNDTDMLLWKQYSIQCWPTLLFLGPDLQPLLSIVGEGKINRLFNYTELVLDYFKSQDRISNHSLPIKLVKETLDKSELLFPGKVSTDGNLLAISDSGHHRIVITDSNGIIKHIIGGTGPGFKDGNFSDCQLHSPQGTVWYNNELYIADTENHAIRLVNFNERSLSTLIGTGEMGTDKEGGSEGTEQQISSPWDLAFIPDQPILLVAMAGTHQIWAYFLNDVTWWKKRQYKKGQCVALVGSGEEENRNNSYPHRAGFAQPSGIVVRGHKIPADCIYVADSESSTVRKISLKDGSVKGLVGGDKNPMNLFAYGDKDGVGINAKLQHPLGVTLINHDDGPLVVADSYNHKIKTIDLETGHCKTLAGQGKGGVMVGSFIETEFNEPGGLCSTPDGHRLYIADTNNNRILVVDLQTDTVSQLPIIFPESSLDITDNNNPDESPWKRITTSSAPMFDTSPLQLPVNTGVSLKFDIKLPSGCHATEEAPSQWQLLLEDNSILEKISDASDRKGNITFNNSDQPSVKLKFSHSCVNYDIYVEFIVYYCTDDDGTCRMSSFILHVPIVTTTDIVTEPVIVIPHQVKM